MSLFQRRRIERKTVWSRTYMSCTAGDFNDSWSGKIETELTRSNIQIIIISLKFSTDEIVDIFNTYT